MAIETYFKNIADAIREKAGTSGLITPAQMPQAIADIPTGGSGGGLVEPIFYGLSYGYVDGNSNAFYSDTNKLNSMSCYNIKAGDKIILCSPADNNVNKNRCRTGFYNRPFTDLEYYINTALTSELIYSAYINTPNGTNGPDYYKNFYLEMPTFTTNGTLIAVSSNTGYLCPFICIKE